MDKEFNFESPFVWVPADCFPRVDPEFIINKCKTVNDDQEFEPEAVSISSYTKYMPLVYELIKLDRLDEAIKFLSDWESLLNTWDSNNNDDQFYADNNLALKHILFATKLYYLLHTEQVEEANKLVRMIVPVASMDTKNQAGIAALKANFLNMYGHDGHHMALEFAKTATELNPNQPEWLFLLAKTKRDIRRSFEFSKEVPMEEYKLFKKSVELKQKSIFLVRLGHTALECAKRLKYTHNNRNCLDDCSQCGEIKDLFNECIVSLKEALRIAPYSPKINAYVVYGIYNFPPKSISNEDPKFDHFTKENLKDLAKDCVEIAKEVVNEDDKTGIFHMVGKYYEKLEKNLDKAELYYKKSANKSYAAAKDLISLKYVKLNYNPLKDLQDLADKFRDIPKQHGTFCQMGSYCLLQPKGKRDLLKSLRYFHNVLANNRHSHTLEKHKSMFLQMQRTVNLYEILINEVLLNIEHRQRQGRYFVQHKSYKELQDFLEKLQIVKPDLVIKAQTHPLKPDLIDDICSGKFFQK